jgi:cytochrome c biogenesis protein
MGFMDMYHSWWFVLLLMLFAANLLICSLDRFPSIWGTVRSPAKPIADEHVKSIPIKREFTLKGNPEKFKARVESAVRAAGFRAAQADEPSGYQFYAQKGSFTRLGVFITHLSIIVIMIGAIIGIFFGFKGQMNVPEGSLDNVVITRTGALSPQEVVERRVIMNSLDASDGDVARAAATLGVEEARLRTRMKRLGIIPLGFSIRCDDFDVSFYGGSDMPKEYTSVLAVIDHGREVLSKRIEVNDPLRYKGITFYQSSYGPLSDSQNFVFILKASSKTGKTETFRLKAGEDFTIPGTGVEASVNDYSPALAFSQDGRPFTYTEMMNNPAVQLEVKSGKDEYLKWIVKRFPVTWTLPGGDTVELVDIWRAQYTGLQVRHDPGVWVVYLGCITMALGLYIAFFMSHRKVWVKVAGDKGSTRFMVGGYANKNREGFERKIEKMASLLREGGK